MKYYGVIMAGGGGTRFWPMSRNKKPKQLLNLSGKDRMINETIDRLESLIEKENLYIVTNCMQEKEMREAVAQKVVQSHILIEPAARNTAACIGYAALEILKKQEDGIMIVTPSDAYVKDIETFTKVLSKAVYAAEMTDKLVTIGITPTFPATGYGYMKYEASQEDAKKVEAFKEKPDLQTAKEYIASKQYVWNSGMFVWKASTILKNIERYLPHIYGQLEKIAKAMNSEEERKVIEEIYPQIESISIDYGVMERSSDVLMVSGEFGWSDVGSWDMMNVLHEADTQGNILLGDCETVDTENTTIYANTKLVAAVGMKDTVIVETEDAVLVCAKEKAQQVKEIVEQLKRKGRTELL